MKGAWISEWERIAQRAGFVLIHDGLKNPGQFNLPPDQVRYYTRKYRLKLLDVGFVNTWLVFVYDLREGEVRMDLTHRDPMKRKESETMVMEIEDTHGESITTVTG